MAIVKTYEGHNVPEGATHYGESTSKWTEAFYDLSGCEKVYSLEHTPNPSWVVTHNNRGDLIELPQEPDQEDWLQKGVKVITPSGTATVERITEDYGVLTSLGNFCRTELSQVPEQYKPVVGEECEFNHPQFGWTGATMIGPFKSQFVCAPNGGDFWGGDLRDFRPIKTERQKIKEWVESKIDCQMDEAIMLTKLLDLRALIIPESDK